MKCIECGNEAVLIKKPIAKYDGLKTENLYLRNIEIEFCPSCEAESLVIRNMNRVHLAIGVGLALQPAKLTGEEVRLLRRLLRFTATEWAARIGIAPETYSRWENGRSPAEQVEKLARIDFLLGVVERLPDNMAVATAAGGLITLGLHEIRDFAVVVDVEDIAKRAEYLDPLQLAAQPVIAHITASTFWTPLPADTQIKEKRATKPTVFEETAICGEIDNASEPFALAA